jgi:isopentenyl phosphate kinase
VLKLGGSVITKKEKDMTPNLDSIDRLAKEIKEAEAEQLIIVHGGGSFGHPLAKQYNIIEGFRKASQIEGLVKTHMAMVKLNRIVVEALINHNIAVFPVSPSSCVVSKSGRINNFYFDTLNTILNVNFTPVLYGDTIFDDEIGFTILSGDQLAVKLAIQLQADKLIFGADVDGLHAVDPKTDGSARLISNITLAELKGMLQDISGSRTVDVTGGMLGKISELINMVDIDIQTIIVNAAKEGNIYKALKGENVIGTLIKSK